MGELAKIYLKIDKLMTPLKADEAITVIEMLIGGICEREGIDEVETLETIVDVLKLKRKLNV